MDNKNYLKSLYPFIIFSLFFFIFSVTYGYFTAKSSPDNAKIVLEQVKKMYEPIIHANRISQFFFVFLNNSFTIFISIILGILVGIFPILVLFSNGILIGILVFLWIQEYPLESFLTGILPHGVIEIPVFIMGTAIGIKIGKIVLYKILRRINIDLLKGLYAKISLKEEISLGLIFFLKFLVPLLAIAAVIEIFITPAIF